MIGFGLSLKWTSTVSLLGTRACAFSVCHSVCLPVWLFLFRIFTSWHLSWLINFFLQTSWYLWFCVVCCLWLDVAALKSVYLFVFLLYLLLIRPSVYPPAVRPSNGCADWFVRFPEVVLVCLGLVIKWFCCCFCFLSFVFFSCVLFLKISVVFFFCAHHHHHHNTSWVTSTCTFLCHLRFICAA